MSFKSSAKLLLRCIKNYHRNRASIVIYSSQNLYLLLLVSLLIQIAIVLLLLLAFLRVLVFAT